MFFNNSAVLLLILIVPALAVLIFWRERIRQAMRRRLAQDDIGNSLFPHVSQRLRWAKSLCWLLTVLLVIIALARPVWGIDIDVIETQGVSVLFLLDVSNSMAADDLTPNRLERARLGIRDLFAQLEGNEVGLILFAGTAFVQLPLTTDTVSAVNFVNSASVTAIGQQGTNIPEALDLAVETFRATNPTARIVVLMTDGESHEGDMEAVVRQAVEADITIHAIGYGSPDGAPVPVLDSAGNLIDYRTDANNNVIFSRLDEATLQMMADRTGGVYRRATPGGAEIDILANRIREVEAGILESRTRQRGIERFGIFVLLALVMLSIEMLLPETRREIVT